MAWCLSGCPSKLATKDALFGVICAWDGDLAPRLGASSAGGLGMRARGPSTERSSPDAAPAEGAHEGRGVEREGRCWEAGRAPRNGGRRRGRGGGQRGLLEPMAKRLKMRSMYLKMPSKLVSDVSSFSLSCTPLPAVDRLPSGRKPARHLLAIFCGGQGGGRIASAAREGASRAGAARAARCRRGGR